MGIAALNPSYGHYNLVAIIEADDEQSALAFATAVGSAGNIRTHTLRAFNAEEISAVLERPAKSGIDRVRLSRLCTQNP